MYKENPDKYPGIQTDEDLYQSEFRKSIDGEVMNQAVIAFWGALADFFPDQATTILKFHDAQIQAMKIIESEMESAIQEISPLVRSGIKKSRESFMKKAKEIFAEELGLNSSELEESSAGHDPTGELSASPNST